MPRNQEGHERSRRRQTPDDELFEREDAPYRKGSWCWAVAIGVFIIHVTIPTVLSSYGVLMPHLIENNVCLMWQGLLPPTAYITAWCFVDPICRNLLSGQSHSSKKTAICGILVVSISVAANSIYQSILLQIMTLGILGGIGSSIAITQSVAVLECHFPTSRRLTQTICCFGIALGQFGMPFLMHGLINHYGIRGSFLLQCGVILQALVGASVLSPPREDLSEITYSSRPRAYTVVDNVEMVDMASCGNGHSGHSPLLPHSRNWKSPADISTRVSNISQTRSPVNFRRHKNINGVDILPEIPEECEDTDSDSEDLPSILVLERNKKDQYSEAKEIITQNEHASGNGFEYQSDKHKYSLHKWRNVSLHMDNSEEINSQKCSCSFQHTRNKSITCDSRNAAGTYVLHSESTEDITCSEMCPRQTSSVFSVKTGRPNVHCLCCNRKWYYKCYLAMLNIPNDIYFYLLVPLFTAFKMPQFLPYVLVNIIVRFCPAVFITFITIYARRKIVVNSPQEASFALSVAAFGWLCFLLLTPCFSDAKSQSYKYLYLIGCTISSAGIYMLSVTKYHNTLIIGCVSFGLGYGALVATIPYVYEEHIGVRNFIKMQGPIDAMSGCFILIISLGLGFLLQDENGFSHCLVLIFALQLLSCLVWIISILRPVFDKIRCIHISEWQPDRDFLPPG